MFGHWRHVSQNESPAETSPRSVATAGRTKLDWLTIRRQSRVELARVSVTVLDAYRPHRKGRPRRCLRVRDEPGRDQPAQASKRSPAALRGGRVADRFRRL